MDTDKIKTKGNHIWCNKHTGWFFSSKYARTEHYPSQCNICKQPKYWEDRKK